MSNSVNEIQVSNTNHSTDIEDNDAIGWRSLHEVATTSEDSNTCDTDETE